MLVRVLLGALFGWAACAVLIQPDLALFATGLAVVVAFSLVAVLTWRVTSDAGSRLAVPSIRHIRADGWQPTCGSGPVARLVLLSQPRR